jgi:hypothetical protein
MATVKMRAINPKEIPPLPEFTNHWSRSTKRAGGMFHAHALGEPVCGAKFRLYRHDSKYGETLSDFQYWGVCPRCYRLAMKTKEAAPK